MYCETKKKVQNKKNEEQIQISKIPIDEEEIFTTEQRKKIFQ